MRIHINVGRINIVNGPGYRHLSSALSLLANDHNGSRQAMGIQTRFTIAAGVETEEPIVVIVRICTLVKYAETDYYFCGRFQDQLVEGNFNPQTKKGDMQDL